MRTSRPRRAERRASPEIAVGISVVPSSPPLGQLRASTVLARLARLDSLVVPDHFQPLLPAVAPRSASVWRPRAAEVFDFQTLLGRLAPLAGRLRLGVIVTEPVRRHPILIAQALLTLAHMTRRAPILGIGAGERVNTEPYGLHLTRPVERLEEALQIIRLCLSSTRPLDFVGRHFRLAGARMDLQAPPGRTPQVWVAGHGPRMLRLTGRYGDGWCPVGIASPTEYAEMLAVVRHAASEAGRDPAAITPSLRAYMLVARSEKEARAALATPAVRRQALLLSADTWSRFGAQHPFGADFRGYMDLDPAHHDRSRIEEATAAVPDALVMEGPLLWGTPEQVADRLRTFGEAGLRHVSVTPMSASTSERSAAYRWWATRHLARLLQVRTSAT